MKKGVKRTQQKYNERQKPLQIKDFWTGICKYEIRYRNLRALFMYLYVFSYISIKPYRINALIVLK